MRKLPILAAALLSLAAPAATLAAPTPVPAPLTAPEWVNKITPEDQMAGAYPDKAKAPSGHVELDCVIGDTGWLTHCRVTAETPKGQGFGAAAIKLATAKARAEPVTHDGERLVGRHVLLVLDINDTVPPPIAARYRYPPATEKTAPLPPGAIPIAERPEGPAPPDLAGISLPEGRLAYLGVIPHKAAILLALDDQRRAGDSIDVTQLTVEAKPYWAYGLAARFRVSRYRFDCAAHTVRFLGSKTYSDEGAYILWLPSDDRTKPLAAPTALGQVAAVACSGQAGPEVVTGVQGAFAAARADPTFAP